MIDLLEQAGADISDWSNYDGPPAANPNYCYNWSFLQPDKFIVTCLWHDELIENDGGISFASSMRKAWNGRGAANMKRRAADFDHNLQQAYQNALPVRAIIIAGTRRSDDDPETAPSRVKQRFLDPEPWAVTSYDFATGQFVIARGVLPFSDVEPSDPEYSAYEGELRLRYIKHRRREYSLRAKKIMAAKIENGGRLRCEVPRCDFDFFERYGKTGEDFAHVHHTVPLAEAADTGRNTPLKELKIVCANCHAMIHRGGQCRDMATLIPEPSRT